MSLSDDIKIIRKLIESLQTYISDLEIEIGEKVPLESNQLDAAQHILQDTVHQLEDLLR